MQAFKKAKRIGVHHASAFDTIKQPKELGYT